MNILKPVLLTAIFLGSIVGNVASATERPPRIGEEKILPKKPEQGTATLAAPAKKPIKRRAVRQILDDDIRPVTPPAVYAPTLTAPRAQPQVHGVPPAPATVNCIGGACSDSNGGRFNGGVGTTLISPQGKLCNHNGLTVQCF